MSRFVCCLPSPLSPLDSFYFLASQAFFLLVCLFVSFVLYVIYFLSFCILIPQVKTVEGSFPSRGGRGVRAWLRKSVRPGLSVFYFCRGLHGTSYCYGGRKELKKVVNRNRFEERTERERERERESQKEREKKYKNPRAYWVSRNKLRARQPADPLRNPPRPALPALLVHFPVVASFSEPCVHLFVSRPLLGERLKEERGEAPCELLATFNHRTSVVRNRLGVGAGGRLRGWGQGCREGRRKGGRAGTKIQRKAKGTSRIWEENKGG